MTPFHLTQPHATHPRYDAGGRLVGYVRFRGARAEDGERAAAIASSECLQQPARWADGTSAGIVSDVIVDLATGRVLAYELAPEDERPGYVPGHWGRQEADGSLRLDRDRPPRLAFSLAELAQREGAIAGADPEEFVVIEALPDPEQGWR